MCWLTGDHCICRFYNIFHSNSSYDSQRCRFEWQCSELGSAFGVQWKFRRYSRVVIYRFRSIQVSYFFREFVRRQQMLLLLFIRAFFHWSILFLISFRHDSHDQAWSARIQSSCSVFQSVSKKDLDNLLNDDEFLDEVSSKKRRKY